MEKGSMKHSVTRSSEALKCMQQTVEGKHETHSYKDITSYFSIADSVTFETATIKKNPGCFDMYNPIWVIRAI